MNNHKQRVRRSGSIVQKLFRPLSILLLVLIVAMVSVLFFGGVLRQLDQNALDILGEQVKNRKGYLENEMVSGWTDLGLTIDSINGKVEQLRDGKQIDLAHIGTDEASYNVMLGAVAEDLISVIRKNSVTGAFLILNTDDLSEDDVQDKCGLYLRDLDPVSSASDDNRDLLLKRAPTALVDKLGIATDSDWRTKFTFEQQNKYDDLFYLPYRTAVSHPELGWSDLGYWSEAYRLPDDSRSAISYSVPLRLADGTLYGVVGIELTLDYLSKVIPNRELLDGSNGSYLLAVTEDGEHFRTVFASGPYQSQGVNGAAAALTLYGESKNNTFRVESDSEKLYAAVQYLSLYNSNAPFSGTRWALIGIADSHHIFQFSRSVQRTVLSLGVILLVLGLSVVCVVSYAISEPVTTLTRDLERAAKDKPLRFQKTHIKEIDLLTSKIESLSDDVFETSLKFTKILEMASIRIGGFEVNKKTGALFVTDDFFMVFGLPNIDAHTFSVNEFGDKLDSLRDYVEQHETLSDGATESVFCMPGTPRSVYVRLRCIESEERVIGLAEDITAATLERQKVEHERDHDLLTGLLSRRAFHRVMNDLFTFHPESLGIAALLMVDLDNLKFINDTYGHDYGDKYIRCLADSLIHSAPPGTLVCRQSGDEMFVFFYGYDSEQKIRNLIRALKQNLNTQSVPLPDGGKFPISASGGIAWYPRNTTDFTELVRYADFAMYEVKRNGKGDLYDFDMLSYRSATRLQKCREEFNLLLGGDHLIYYWQPIISTRTGDIFAYEALMRSDLETLKMPKDILEIAQQESQLNRIESMTLFSAMGSFVSHCENGRIAPGVRAFINSIPNQLLTQEDSEQFETRFADYLPRFVVEITENERVREGVLEEKRRWNRRWNAAFALDDYGSGYNSEYVLLTLAPEYVKIDMSLVRDIDIDRDKQKIVGNLISYASERGIRLVAEGVETKAELETVIRMGVDYVQGYFLARPAFEPPLVPEELVRLVRSISAQSGLPTNGNGRT
ncbi:EAL domain-containing protein [Butyricicoccus faecihominis]|uniref:EAL domain-containing protein n=1 Tax=Butyricicoccus faecihominis TaxID=1712515 RepID=UPI002479F00B|nr:EAL domain-containing protein [Butyricicoccus faecihominis]MCQ5129906.1 EAL domain-containing protein [Butyricicoccus faecihominis]